MKIGIIGGGNMGCVLATKFSQKHDVVLYTNLLDKYDLYKKDMSVICDDTNTTYKAKIKEITTSLKDFCNKSEYIFITFPSFLFSQLAKDIEPHLTKKHHLFFVPGSGGAELFFKNIIDKGVTISGLQRVHSVARIVDFGSLTRESGIRKTLYCASIPHSYNQTARDILADLYNMDVQPLNNYLNITLINSNPILHTSRLYRLFSKYPKEIHEYDTLPLFYEDWDNETSDLLINMDEELFSLIRMLNKDGIKVDGIKTLLEHYESTNCEQLTNKIKSIKSFKGLTTPSIVNSRGKLEPDFDSRYFTADFTYGLDIILSFLDFVNVAHPHSTTVSNWYHLTSNTKRIFSLSAFGFDDINSLKSFYLK